MRGKNMALRGSVLIGQSGGPTSVINSSLLGIYEECAKYEFIENIYGAQNGIVGAINGWLINIRAQDKQQLELLKNTPASALGSCRYKLDKDLQHPDYQKILETFVKYNIRYFFYIGGNDSMDSAYKISQYLQAKKYECRVIGIPKTIDNDLDLTDHTPGYGSAAKYIATTLMELKQDADVYSTPSINIVEIMGRNAGWLTASAMLAKKAGLGPDLFYLPEQTFSIQEFIADVQRVLKKQPHVFVVVSEGIKDIEGNYIAELYKQATKDAFAHTQLGGVAQILANELKKVCDVKSRAIELSTMQRSSAHLQSKTDVQEAYNSGVFGATAAIMGHTDKMIAVKRVPGQIYKLEYGVVSLSRIKNSEKRVPLEWIKKDHTGLTDDFIEYAEPLIQGEMKTPFENGLPKYFQFKK